MDRGLNFKNTKNYLSTGVDKYGIVEVARQLRSELIQNELVSTSK